jgi:hypothetical protein
VASLFREEEQEECDTVTITFEGTGSQALLAFEIVFKIAVEKRS